VLDSEYPGQRANCASADSNICNLREVSRRYYFPGISFRGKTMRTGISMFAVIASISLASISFAGVACTAQSSADRPHLVELYTSEGCDSCPPAERWMSSLLKHPDLAGLEFHVDYWDDAQWRDPFSQRNFTERQKAIAKRGNGGEIYTPQIWIDGHVWKNWPKDPPAPMANAAPPPLTLQVNDTNDTIHVQLNAAPADANSPGHYKFYVALTENGLAKDVRGGENHGKHLQHDEVVRAFAGPLDFPRAETTLQPPSDMKLAQATVVAFIQDESEGSVIQIVRQPLDTCTK
jgi:hypothetical protein